MKFILPLSSWTLALLLGGAAVDKVFHWDAYLLTLNNYPFLPSALLPPAGMSIIFVEIFTAAHLIHPRKRMPGLILAGALFAVFTAAITYLYILRSDSPCGCVFTFGSGRADLVHLAMNVACTILAFHLWWTCRGAYAHPAPADSDRGSWRRFQSH